VDHRIEAPQRIDLSGDPFGLFHVGQVADDRVLGAGSRGQSRLGALWIAAMQEHLMTLLDQDSGRHQSKTVGRAGDENLGHV
jgi:hypothetical protein